MSSTTLISTSFLVRAFTAGIERLEICSILSGTCINNSYLFSNSETLSLESLLCLYHATKDAVSSPFIFSFIS